MQSVYMSVKCERTGNGNNKDPPIITYDQLIIHCDIYWKIDNKEEIYGTIKKMLSASWVDSSNLTNYANVLTILSKATQ